MGQSWLEGLDAWQLATVGAPDFGWKVNKGTPRKTNMEPKNGGLEDHFPF